MRMLTGIKFKNKGGGVILRSDPTWKESFLWNHFWPQPRAYVFGGGHVGGQVAALAKTWVFMSFSLMTVHFLPTMKERHPYADECIAGEIESVFASLSLDQHSYVLALTRGINTMSKWSSVHSIPKRVISECWAANAKK